MATFSAWLASDGLRLSSVLEQHREQICEIVSKRLATVYPNLCYDDSRPDAEYFQRHTFSEVPRRFQRVLQAVLLFQSLDVIEHEYRWGWKILPNYGVTRQQLRTQVRWYFDALRLSIPLESADLPHVSTLESTILEIIERVTAAEILVYHRNA